MRVRDAVENDAEAIAALSGRPVDAAREMVHDRSVRVAVANDESGSTREAAEASDEPIGYVAFDARGGTVHVTGLDGDRTALKRLLEEPKRFASGEGLAIEAIVDREETERRGLLEDAGFDRAGAGPRFEGTPTVRYRIEVDDRR